MHISKTRTEITTIVGNLSLVGCALLHVIQTWGDYKVHVCNKLGDRFRVAKLEHGINIHVMKWYVDIHVMKWYVDIHVMKWYVDIHVMKWYVDIHVMKWYVDIHVMLLSLRCGIPLCCLLKINRCRVIEHVDLYGSQNVMKITQTHHGVCHTHKQTQTSVSPFLFQFSRYSRVLYILHRTQYRDMMKQNEGKDHKDSHGSWCDIILINKWYIIIYITNDIMNVWVRDNLSDTKVILLCTKIIEITHCYIQYGLKYIYILLTFTKISSINVDWKHRYIV